MYRPYPEGISYFSSTVADMQKAIFGDEMEQEFKRLADGPPEIGTIRLRLDWAEMEKLKDTIHRLSKKGETRSDTVHRIVLNVAKETP